MRKMAIYAILTFCLTLSTAYAAKPRIFFTDLNDGPRSGWNGSSTKGAAVSVWGLNFGDRSTSARIFCCGQYIDSTDPEYVAEWNAPGDARGLRRITFFLKNDMTLSAGNISITTTGGTSNPLPFFIRSDGNIRFVDHNNGNNTYSGELDNRAWQTLEYARKQIGGGDLLYIRSGTYTELDSYGSMLFLDGNLSGNQNGMTALVGYPGEKPLLDTRPNGIGRPIRNNAQYHGDVHHITIAKMLIYPTGVAISIVDSLQGNFRIAGIVADGLNGSLPVSSTWSGCLNVQNLSYAKILGCVVKGWGRDKYDHATYFGCNTAHPGRNTIEWEVAYNEIYGLGPEVSGIYLHPMDSGSGYADDVFIHHNKTYDLSHAGIFTMARMRNVYIYDNIVYDCGSASGRAAVQLGAVDADNAVSNIRFYNNTVHSATGSGLVILHTNANVDSANNIYWSLSNTPFIAKIRGREPAYNGTFTSGFDVYHGNNNIPQEATNSILLDPAFTDAVYHIYSLQSDSACINRGKSVIIPDVDVFTDYYGLERDGEPDIGAVEYSTASAGKGDINGDQTVDLKDTITALQTTAGLSVTPLNPNGDVNGDNAIGVEEAIQTLLMQANKL